MEHRKPNNTGWKIATFVMTLLVVLVTIGWKAQHGELALLQVRTVQHAETLAMLTEAVKRIDPQLAMMNSRLERLIERLDQRTNCP